LRIQTQDFYWKFLLKCSKIIFEIAVKRKHSSFVKHTIFITKKEKRKEIGRKRETRAHSLPVLPQDATGSPMPPWGLCQQEGSTCCAPQPWN
jgi:hypothetical protein